jgi:hypothetical protein
MIQKHDASLRHYDFRRERCPQVLRRAEASDTLRSARLTCHRRAVRRVEAEPGEVGRRPVAVPIPQA